MYPFENEVVWLTEQRCYAFLLKMGAHFSTVGRYLSNGDYTTFEVENDEFIFWLERGIEYEDE